MRSTDKKRRTLYRIKGTQKEALMPLLRRALRNNTGKQERTTTAEASIVALSIFVALSVGIIGFLVTRSPFEFGFNAATVASGSLLFAVSLFLLSLEFFVLAIFYPQHVAYFGFIGSSLYGIGLMSMIVGISMALQSFQMGILSYLFLTWLFVGYIIYYVVRASKLGLEKPQGWRLAFRLVLFIVLGIGYFLLSRTGG